MLPKDTKLSDKQIKLGSLSKGLSFVPKPKNIDIWDPCRDVRDFMTKARLKFMLYNNKNKITKPTENPFKINQKVKLNEQLTVHKTFNTALWNIRQELMENERTYKQNKSDNLNKMERTAINELKNNPNIIINKADKGTTVVVEDRSTYIQNAMKHLNDPQTNQPLSHNIKNALIKVIQDQLSDIKQNGFIIEDWHKFCSPPDEHRTSRLYFLKISTRTPMASDQ